nr:hypothetical protein [Ligilactobacillus ruminis]
MAGRKSDFTLTKLDDLFTTQAQREEKLSKIRDITMHMRYFTGVDYELENYLL